MGISYKYVYVYAKTSTTRLFTCIDDCCRENFVFVHNNSIKKIPKCSKETEKFYHKMYDDGAKLVA